jgi:hypothetical protein
MGEKRKIRGKIYKSGPTSDHVSHVKSWLQQLGFQAQ